MSRFPPSLRAFLARAAAALSLLLLAGAMGPGPLAADQGHAVVIELFTSQGCSSCPPADRLLGEIKTREDVIALSLPVDYWDYLGWQDSLASPANAKRQRAYARRRGERNVYTPQMVIDGRLDVVGSDRAEVMAAIDKAARRTAASRVELTLENAPRTITVHAGARPPGLDTAKGTIWLVLTTDRETVAIGRGENAGRTLAYHNVVRQMVPIATWSGDSLTVELSKKDLMVDSYDACTVLIQENDAGPIIAAAHLTSEQVGD